MQSADMFASIAVFATPPQRPSSRYQRRKRAVCTRFKAPLAAAESSGASGGDQRVAALLCQASPGREVCIYRS